MNTKDFLTRVSATLDDVVVCLWKPDPTGQNPQGIFWNRGSFHDFDDAAAAIQMWDKDPEWSVFYSVGRMANNAETDPVTGKTKYRRTQAHATCFKTLAFDQDIGADKKCKTQKEGLAAAYAAFTILNLPDPMVVSSGRGIHYYWPLDRAISAADWTKLSDALAMALVTAGLEYDTSKIRDTSMVLRPAGAHNKKQTPWLPVEVKSDCPDYNPHDLVQVLSAYIGKSPAPRTGQKKRSAIMDAVLKNPNLNLEVLGRKCQQIGAMLATKGEFDKMGNPIEEPMWRVALGIAAHTPDPEASIMMLCSGHPEFDFDANMKKMAGWTTGPATCAEIERKCPGGCNGCPRKGQINSPAALNEEQVSTPQTPIAMAQAAVAQAEEPDMPDGYYIFNGQVYKDVESEVKDKDADGNPTKRTVITKTLICPYEIHVHALYRDLWGGKPNAYGMSHAVLSVKYPLDGTHEHELPLGVLFGGGKDFSSFLGLCQIIIPSPTTTENTRVYLMNYLKKVQSKAPSGIDFKHFGYQSDDSFLCGDMLIGSPSSNTSRRLKDTARLYADVITRAGSRDKWADLTKLIDSDGAQCFGVSLLTACAGALGNISGAATPIVSFVSDKSGTGKTLSLAIGNSAFMNPSSQYMFLPKDTVNSLYHNLGVFGDLSGSIDEYTTQTDVEAATELAYSISSGREKQSMTAARKIREPETWRAPLRLTSNVSLHDMFDMVQSKDEPLRLRTLEFPLNTREFVTEHGKTIFETLQDNYGHAMPELVNAVITMGGRKEVWRKGADKFEQAFPKAIFRSEERFYRNTIIVSWIVGKIGERLGLFQFDIDRIINFMLDRVETLRNGAAVKATDGLDQLGQFMQENNHQLIVVRKEFGKQEQVQFPVPNTAVMRMEIVYDAKNPVMPGSTLAINTTALKAWLRKGRDSYERLVLELQTIGAAQHARQRVTMYKNCPSHNPGQAHCLILDLTHPRMAAVVAGRPVMVPTAPMPAVMQPTP